MPCNFFSVISTPRHSSKDSMRSINRNQMGRVKRIWYLSPMRAAKFQASLRICAVSPEPPLLAHTGSESRGTFRQKARSLPPLNGWACAIKICHDGMLEDTTSRDVAQMQSLLYGLVLDWYGRFSSCGSSLWLFFPILCLSMMISMSCLGLACWSLHWERAVFLAFHMWCVWYRVFLCFCSFPIWCREWDIDGWMS